MTGRVSLDHMTSDRLDQLVRLLDQTEAYLAALHTHTARHDNLAAGLRCAGCELRDKIRAALTQETR